MIFSFLNRRKPGATPSEATQAIEDAILLGGVREIDGVLAMIKGDERFSEDLRYGLEALRYFREFYGQNGVIEPAEPLQKQKAVVLETTWGSVLLDKLKRQEDEALQQA